MLKINDKNYQMANRLLNTYCIPIVYFEIKTTEFL